MAALATAFVNVLANTKGLAPGVVGGAQKAGAAGGATAAKGFRGSFIGGLKGIAGPLAAIFAGTKIFGFFKNAVAGASDLEESVNAVNVVFGDAAQGVLKLSKQAARGVGLSKAEFNGLAVQFSAFAKEVAGAEGDVTGTIDKITTRAADFASVMNIDVSKAAEIFQSGLAGETEPLRKFGIDLSAATVKAHAYKEGIAESGEELTEQQKIQARYSALMQQTNQVQGDFANTSGSLANQQRILSARWTDIQATLGKALLPAVTAVVTSFGDLLDVMVAAGGWVSRNKEVFIALGIGIAAVLVPAFVSWAISAGAAAAATIAAAAPVLALVAVIAAAAFLIIKHWDKVKAVALAVWGGIKRFLDAVWGAIGDEVMAVFGFYRTVITDTWNVVRKVTTTVWNFISGFLGAIWGAIGGVVTGAVGTISNVIETAWNVIKRVTSVVWNAVETYLRGVWRFIKGVITGDTDAIKSVISNAWNTVQNLNERAWDAVRDFIRNAWNRIREAVKNGVDRVIKFFRELPGNITSALGDLGDLLYDKGKEVIQGFIDGVKSLAGNAAGAVKDTVVGAAKDVGSFLNPFGGAGGAGGKGGARSPGGAGRVLGPGSYRIGRGSSAHGYLARDLPAPIGTPVFAPFAGILSNASVQGSYGNHVRIAGQGRGFLAAHLSRFARPGGLVNKGDVIGFVGSTGNSTGPHLHIETTRNGRPVVPSSMLNFAMGGFAKAGGLAMVGEMGRELVAFGHDARVFNNRQTEAIMSKGAAGAALGGGGMPRELVVRDYDGTLLGRMRVEAERTADEHDDDHNERLAFGGVV